MPRSSYSACATMLLIVNSQFCLTTKGIFITQVTFDPKFMESIRVTLETFWVTHVIPRMMKNVQAEVNPVELLGNF